MTAAALPKAGEKGTVDWIGADRGWFWVRLMTRQALEREGAAMSHCVGDGDHAYLCGGEEITDDAIWSLRDAEGASRLTIQITSLDIDSAKGPHNHDPSKNSALQVRHLVAAFKAAGSDLTMLPITQIVLAPDGRTFRQDRVPADVQAELDAARREAEEARARRMREAEERRATEPVYRLGRGQVMIRTVGVDTQGGPARFRPLGDVGEFSITFDGVDLSSSEAPLRPLIAQIEHAWLMTFTPGGDRIGPPPHPIFGMFEDLPNPVIAMRSRGAGTGVILSLQDGQQIPLTAAETAAIAVRDGSLIDRGGLLHGKVMALQPAPEEGAVRMTSFPEVVGGHVYIIAHEARVATVTSQGGDLLKGEDFDLAPSGGFISFHRDLRDVEILWEEVSNPPATRSNRDADLERFGYRPFLTVDGTESRSWGSFALSADVARLRVGGTP